MLRLSRFIASIFVVLMMTITNACTCTLSPLSINPISPGRTDIFVGESKYIELQFKNEKTEGNVEVFPEPPLIVKNRKFNTKCSIDGGVWVRKSVFVSNNDTVIVTQEFSGSNDSLIFYDAQSCKKINEIDVSDSTWSIQGSEISITKQITGDGRDPGGIISYHLDGSCYPLKSCK